MGFQIGPFIVGSPPTAAQEHAVLAKAPELGFNFRNGSGSFYVHDVCQAKIGEGRRDYDRAKSLLLQWQHFNLSWARTNAPRIIVNNPVIVVARSLGLWSINPLRISAKKSSRNAMSFTHRTLEGHQISGEETFTLELRGDGGVWYGVETVSRPATVVSALSLPVLRFYQGKFKRDSLQRMKDLLRV